MNISILKHGLQAIAGVVILSHMTMAQADNQGGSFTTGVAAGVDFYQISCFDDGNGAPSYVEAQVKDTTANSSKVNILLYKGTSCTTNKCAQFSLDTTDSDIGYSPLVRVTQGSGTYNLFVQHTATGTDGYDVIAHCKTSGGVHTGTSFVSKQQQ